MGANRTRPAHIGYWSRSNKNKPAEKFLRGSPTEGATQHTDLDGNQHRGIYIPPGVAHGFSTLTDATITYLVDNYYNPADELGVAWNDPEIGADWGLKDPVLSTRDQTNPLRNDIDEALRPRYGLRN